MASTSRSAVKKPFTKQRYQCASKKVRYRDHKEATRFLHIIENQRRDHLEIDGVTRRNESRSYLCPECRGWHTTSQPERSNFKNQW